MTTIVSPLWPPALVSSQRTQRVVTSRCRGLSHITSPDMHRTRVTSHHKQRRGNISQSEAIILVSRPMRSQKRLTFGRCCADNGDNIDNGLMPRGGIMTRKTPPEKVKVGTGFMSEVVCRVTRQMLSGNGTFITRRGQNIRRGAREKHCHWSLASVSSSPCSLWRH